MHIQDYNMNFETCSDANFCHLDSLMHRSCTNGTVQVNTTYLNGKFILLYFECSLKLGKTQQSTVCITVQYSEKYCSQYVV